MTPLAYELLKDLTTPGAFRAGASKRLGETNFITSRDSFWSAVTAAHFFDLSAVAPLVQDISAKMREAFDSKSCLHFVRTFLRVRLGQLEYVESHWRGNPALGMKRSRYRLEEGTDQP